MRKLRRSALALSILTSSVLASEASLEEAFIELRVGNSGDGFYRVMMDEDETPYLSAEAFLKSWFELNVDCVNEQLFCQVMLPGEKEPFVIDAIERESGKSSELLQWEDSDDLVVIDNRVWVKHTTLSKWIPASTTWSKSSYVIAILPEFKLASRKIAELESIRKQERRKKEDREKFLLSGVESPESKSFGEGRFEYSVGYNSAERTFSDAFSYDLAADIKDGTFSMGGNLLSEDKEGLLGYWSYENLESDYFNYWGVGQVQFGGSLITNPVLLENGIRISRKNKAPGAGKFYSREKTEPMSTIDIYVNGFYQKTINADEYGFYIIDDLSVSSGDVVVAKEVTQDGAEIDKRISVSGDSGEYLSEDDWDMNISFGEADDKKYSYKDFRYGILDHYTLSFANYTFDMDNETGGLSRKSYQSASLMGRIGYSVSYGIEAGLTERSNAYKIDWDLGGSSHLAFESRVLDENGDLQNSDWFDSYGDEFHEISHRFSHGRYQVRSSVNKSDSAERYEIEVNRKFEGRLHGSAKLGYLDDKKDDFYTSLLLNKAMDDGGTLEGSVSYQGEKLYWSGYWRYIGKTSAPWLDDMIDRPWMSNLGLNYDEDSHWSPSVSFSWQQSELVSGTFSATKDNFSIGLSIKFGAAHNKMSKGWSSQSWHNFGQGNVSGYLKAPEVNGYIEPLQGVKVNVSNYSAITNEDGYFMINDIPANQEFEMFIDENTMDIRLTPQVEKTKVKVRPGTRLEINPGVAWAIGVDGIVSGLLDGAYTIDFHGIDNNLKRSAPIESDGFYIVERLMPGKYKVFFENNGELVYETEVELNNEDWISDVNFSLD